MHENLIAEARAYVGPGSLLIQELAAALASTPSPAQPTEAHSHRNNRTREGDFAELQLVIRGPWERWLDGEWRVIDGLAPSPVQGADDRLAREVAAKAVWVAQQYDQAWAASAVDDVFSPADDWPEDALLAERLATAALATYHQSPQAALNEVRAGAHDEAVAMVCEMAGLPNVNWPNPHRAAELRAAPQTGDSE